MRSSAVPPSSKGSAAVDAQMRELSSSLSSMRVSATSRAQPADEGGDCDSKQEQSTGYALDTEGLSAVKCVYIMRGLPGSGKSTMARAIQGWCQAHGASDALILSTDDFHTRSDGTYAWKKELAGQAHQWNQDRFKRALLTRSDVVIVDNTNITLAEAYPYVHLAVQYGYAVKIRAPRTPWSSDPVQLAARNTHAVPLETIRRRLALMKKVRVYTVERILQSVREQRPGARNTEAPKKPTPSTLQPEQKKETHNSSSAPRKKHTPHGSSSRGNRQVWSEGLSRFGDPSAEDMDAFTARFRLEGLGDDQQLPDFKTLMNLFMVERTMGFLAERYAHSQPLRGGLYLRMAPIARDRSFFFGQHFTYPAYTQTMNPEVSTDSSCSMQQPLRAHASASLRRTHFDNTTGDWVVDYKSIDAFELHKLRSLARFAGVCVCMCVCDVLGC
jgi:predicted kinase